MEEQAEPIAERKPRRGVLGLFVWPVLILLLYVLIAGPLTLMQQKGMFRPGSTADSLLGTIYTPLTWAYMKTPLHKPLGMYLHLWCPGVYDKNGEPPKSK